MYHDIAFVFTGSLTGPVYVGFLTEPTLCFAYVGSLTGPTLAFCSMADSVTKFGLFRKSQQYILAAVTQPPPSGAFFTVTATWSAARHKLLDTME